MIALDFNYMYMIIGNPCEEDKPFLCRSSPTCISLDQVCDTIPHCPDGFDESPRLCNASMCLQFINVKPFNTNHNV